MKAWHHDVVASYKEDTLDQGLLFIRHPELHHLCFHWGPHVYVRVSDVLYVNMHDASRSLKRVTVVNVSVDPRVAETAGIFAARPAGAGSGGRSSDLSLRKLWTSNSGLLLRRGAEWVAKVIESGSRRWKPHHYQLMKKQTPKRSYLLKAYGGSKGEAGRLLPVWSLEQK